MEFRTGEIYGKLFEAGPVLAKRFCCLVLTPCENVDSMRTTSAATRQGLSAALWTILILLAVSAFFNYIDRGNLSIAAELIKADLRLSDRNLGILLSSFFWTYALCHIAAGWLVDRFNVSWVIAGGFFLWSVSTAATGLVTSFGMLLGLRMLLGVGESVAYPSYSKILAGYFPEHHRGFANALIDAGSKSGPAIGTLAGGFLMATYSWRPFFLVLGVINLVWLLPWFFWMPRGRSAATGTPKDAPEFREILRLRSAWGTFGGLFCTNYFWYFLLTWLPSYLVRERQFSMKKMATVGAAAYFAIAVSSTFSGWLSDRLIARGGTPTRVRKTFTAVGLSLSTIILPVALVADHTTATVLLLVACFSFGIYNCCLWSITQTIAGPRAAGRWVGLQNCIGNLAGWVAPWLTGVVLDVTHQFFWAFVIAAAVQVVAICMFVLVVGPIKPYVWNTRS
jgi:MFS transporter, ACS family, D-galactonate transporter